MFDPVHLHLVLSHVPVVGVGAGIVVLVWGFVGRSDDVKKASLGLFALCAISAVAAFATGEPAEQRVERLAGVNTTAIEKHEDAGKLAAIATYVLGGVSVAGLLWIWRLRRAQLAIFTTTLVIALVAAVLLARAANIGGLIRHTEIGSTSNKATEDH